MLSILSTRRFARWTALFKTWLKQQLDAIAESIDFGPVEEKIDEVENKIGVADVVDLGLPVSKENGFCAIDDDNDFKPVDTDISSTQTNNYQVGSIIKPTTLGSDYEEYVVPKTVSDVPTDIWYNDSEGILNGVLTQIVWEVGKYYRVTGIYDCYNEDKTEVIDHIFTYEEVSEETVAKLISNISIDTSDLAKEATLNSVGQAAAAAKTAAQNAETKAQAAKDAALALAPVAQAAEAYNTGKTELAENITAKGVPASASETLPELAEKVSAIAQESYTIDGGEMYEKQLLGSLETPNYWNLYEILEQLLSDGRLVSYGGILLAEYYKGYDSLALAGAGAGGAYVVSDVENGVFKMYTNDTTHTWATEDDGKGNRWVAYCFADEYHDFQITNTDTSPRSIFIGRKVGVITSLVNGRVSDIVVPDGNKLGGFVSGTFTQNWGKNVVIRNLEDAPGCILQESTFETCYIELARRTGTTAIIYNKGDTQLTKNIIIDLKEEGIVTALINMKSNNAIGNVYINYLLLKGAKIVGQYLIKGARSLGSIILQDVEKININSSASGIFTWCSVNKVFLPSLEEAIISHNNANLVYSSSSSIPCKYLFIGYKTNDRARSVTLKNNYDSSEFTDIELKDGYKKNLNVSALTSYLTAENIALHMLDRLADNTGEETLELTIGATNLARIMADETYAPYVAAAQAKNWTIS